MRIKVYKTALNNNYTEYEKPTLITYSKAAGKPGKILLGSKKLNMKGVFKKPECPWEYQIKSGPVKIQNCCYR